jgi:hypothetical protein
MKQLSVVMASVLALACASAHATPCDQIQAGIDAKIKAKGVSNYTLDAVPAAEVGDRKVVGSCAGGSMKIVYARMPAATTTATTGSGPTAALTATASP